MGKDQKLSFITNKDLYKHVAAVINASEKSLEQNEKKFYRNSVDPFSAVFDAMWQNVPMAEWIEQEKSRQNQKTLQNALGNFHQNIIGSIVGFSNLGTGSVVDVRSDQKKIIAEIKNKHNTTKGNHKVAIYDDLSSLLKGKFKGFTAYYVEVIPKNKKIYNKPFTPSDNKLKKRRPTSEFIRVVDGKTFYEIATGDPDALRKLYLVLPVVIADILGKSGRVVKDDSFTALFDRIY